MVQQFQHNKQNLSFPNHKTQVLSGCMHIIILQTYINRSSFERHTLVMFHYILVCPSSKRGKPKRSLHNLPKENNGFKLNFIQQSSRKKVVAKKAYHETIFSLGLDSTTIFLQSFVIVQFVHHLQWKTKKYFECPYTRRY